MTIDKHRHDLEDDRLRVAAAIGFGLTIEKTAEFAGVSGSTVKRWKDDPEIKGVAAIVSAGLSVWRALNVDSELANINETAEKRIKRLFDRSFLLSEQALKRAEMDGDKVTLEQLMAIHENFTKWAAKYAASEAPKRLDVNQTTTKTVYHVVGLADAENILSTQKQLQQIAPKALIAGGQPVIDVIADA